MKKSKKKTFVILDLRIMVMMMMMTMMMMTGRRHLVDFYAQHTEAYTQSRTWPSMPLPLFAAGRHRVGIDWKLSILFFVAGDRFATSCSSIHVPSRRSVSCPAPRPSDSVSQSDDADRILHHQQRTAAAAAATAATATRRRLARTGRVDRWCGLHGYRLIDSTTP